MRFLSLFSGIEAASVAWIPLGWECVAVAEIDRFACDLLERRFPDVPNLGDVTKITRAQVEALGHIDVVIAGFPCQDVSVAGKRAGLKSKDGKRTRSGLFHVARRLIHWSRARWTVLENVPGLFTSNDGRDFATVVGSMVGRQFVPPPGGWRNAGVAAGRLGMVEWATLDSQFFHVAQRRERVFLVRDAGAWADRPPVLLVPQSSLGNPPTRGEARSGVAGTLTPSAARRGPGADPHSGGQTLLAEPGAEVHPPLSAGDHSAGGGRRPGMSADDAAGLVSVRSKAHTGSAAKEPPQREHRSSGCEEVRPITADAAGGRSGDAETAGADAEGRVRLRPPGLGVGNPGDPSHTLSATGVPAVAITAPLAFRKSRRAQSKHDDETWVADGRANTLNAFDVGERDTHAVVAPVAFPDPAYALSAGAGGSKFGSGREKQDTFVTQDEPIPFDPKQIGHPANHSSPKAGAPCHPLRAVANCEPAIAFHITQDPISGRTSPALSSGGAVGSGTIGVAELDVAQPLRTNHHNNSDPGMEARMHVYTGTRVRRLTPLECERLQGFPDGWTKIGRRKSRKSKHDDADGPRYRALGNSMTTTVIRWIGEQIERAVKGAP